ncbi:unnamed protein product [Dibothriocephalus latus]|uniref:Uncharacterized protein n=1 Tax=Dibothriocephalus latus TaxID=60516 RepID=A0A3P7LZX7_DIBLA|nr:unnamed protein product [Dibothriocephalus latus]
MDGVERSGKVDKADGRWLLVALSEFKDPSQCEYLIHTFTPSVASGLVGLRPVVAHRLEPLEENNSEMLRGNADEAYTAIFLTFCLIFLLMDRHKDA